MVRRGNTKALGRIQVYGSDTRSTHHGARELGALTVGRKEISTSRVAGLYGPARTAGRLQSSQKNCKSSRDDS